MHVLKSKCLPPKYHFLKLLKPDNMNDNKNTECCPPFDPVAWDNKILEWNDKKFIKDRVFTLFYIPINFGSVVKRMMRKIEKAGAKAQDWMGLSDHTSKWNMDLYVAVDREIPDALNVTLGGKFFSRVYEGDFKNTKEWCDDFTKSAREKNLKIEKMYMWYTTCPKCAKKYGKNYVVVIAKVVKP
jgi:hypothetical protein